MTQYISDVCPHCGEKKITLDKHYGLPECFDFILLCPKHPADVYFDLPLDNLSKIARSCG